MEKANVGFNGYLPNGLKVFYTFPLDTLADMVALAGHLGNVVALTDVMISQGFALQQPGLEALEPGEHRESVSAVLRRKFIEDDGTIVPVIDIYPDNPALGRRCVFYYLNDDKQIAEFETATGLKLTELPIFDDAQLNRIEKPELAKKFLRAIKVTASVVFKDNPAYDANASKKKAKHIFVRWESANSQPSPTPQPSQPATTPAGNGKVTPDEARNAELRNEELVITRVEPRSDSTGWYGYGLFNDDISNQEVRVNLFAPEDPKTITDAGYQWVTSGKVQWPVVLKIDRNMTRIGTVIPKQTAESLGTPPSAENGQASVLPSWTGNAVGTCWAVLKQYLLSEHIYDNEYEMKNSFTKRGITVDNKIAPTWKNKPARELIEYCNSRKITDVDFMADGKQPA